MDENIKVLFLKGKASIAPNEFCKDVEIALFQQFYGSLPEDTYLKGYLKGMAEEFERNIRDDFWYVPVDIIAELNEQLEKASQEVETLIKNNREILLEGKNSIETLSEANSKLKIDVEELRQGLEAATKNIKALELENEQLTIGIQSQKVSHDFEVMCLKAKLYDLTQLVDHTTPNLKEVM